MKVLFVEAGKKDIEGINTQELSRLPKQLHIFYTIQYKTLAEDIRKHLAKTREIASFEQVIGCSKVKPKSDILLVGSGKFHAYNLAMQTSRQIFIYTGGKISRLDEKEISNMKARQKAKISRFLASDKIGILTSTKLGQNRVKEAIALKKELEKKHKDKEFYIFTSNIINTAEVENFPVDMFINLACPGLEADSNKIINYDAL